MQELIVLSSMSVAAAVDLDDHDRARTAVTFGATFFRAGHAQVFAQELQHRARRVGNLVSTTSPFRMKRISSADMWSAAPVRRIGPR